MSELELKCHKSPMSTLCHYGYCKSIDWLIDWQRDLFIYLFICLLFAFILFVCLFIHLFIYLFIDWFDWIDLLIFYWFFFIDWLWLISILSLFLSFFHFLSPTLSLSLSLCQVWQQKNIVEDFIFSLRKSKSGLKTRLLVSTFRCTIVSCTPSFFLFGKWLFVSLRSIISKVIYVIRDIVNNLS